MSSAKMFFRGTITCCAVTVSYTHLDVYKRQHLLKVRLSVLVCILAGFSFSSQAQSITTGNGKVELGLGIGPMFFLGDLGGSAGVGKTFIKDLDLPLTKLNKGLYVNYYPTEWFGLRLAGNLGYVSGDDAQAPSKGCLLYTSRCV